MNFIFDNERPIYIQLVEQLQIYIISGKINPGGKLDSVRELALKIKVNPNTVQRALNELESQNLIYTQRTNGKYVTTDVELIKKYKEKYATKQANIYFSSMKELGYTKEEAILYLKNKGGIK